MAEDYTVYHSDDKTQVYDHVLAVVRSITAEENDVIANMANICAVLKEQFGWLWVGFYIVRENELVLGPFQGPLACTRIAWGKGVCGTAWKVAATIIVPDVNQFPGHIACSSQSLSEIVVPLIDNNGIVSAVLDVDSSELNTFDETDKFYLEQIANTASQDFK